MARTVATPSAHRALDPVSALKNTSTSSGLPVLDAEHPAGLLASVPVVLVNVSPDPPIVDAACEALP